MADDAKVFLINEQTAESMREMIHGIGDQAYQGVLEKFPQPDYKVERDEPSDTQKGFFIRKFRVKADKSGADISVHWNQKDPDEIVLWVNSFNKMKDSLFQYFLMFFAFIGALFGFVKIGGMGGIFLGAFGGGLFGLICAIPLFWVFKRSKATKEKDDVFAAEVERHVVDVLKGYFLKKDLLVSSPEPEAKGAPEEGQPKKKKKSKTLPLLLVALGLVGLFVYLNWHEKAKVNTTRSELAQISAALKRFENDVGRFPALTEGLIALRKPLGGVDNWNGPYLRGLLRLGLDPWEREYKYRPSEGKEGEFKLYSLGADGLPGTADDVWAEE